MATKPRALRLLPHLLLLAAVLVVQAGCAETDADLNYTRDQPAATSGDHSYHGWNDANN